MRLNDQNQFQAWVYFIKGYQWNEVKKKKVTRYGDKNNSIFYDIKTWALVDNWYVSTIHRLYCFLVLQEFLDAHTPTLLFNFASKNKTIFLTIYKPKHTTQCGNPLQTDSDIFSTVRLSLFGIKTNNITILLPFVLCLQWLLIHLSLLPLKILTLRFCF